MGMRRLLEAGHIPAPFVADNEKRVQWVAGSSLPIDKLTKLHYICFSLLRNQTKQ